MLQIIKVYIASLMCMIQLFGFGIILFKTKITTNLKKNIIIYLVSSIFAALVFANFEGTIKTLLLCIVFATTFYLVFGLSSIRSIFTSLIYVILNIIPEIIVLNIMIYILGISKEYCYNYIAGGIIMNITIAILMIILTYVFRKPLRKLVNYNVSTNKKIVIISIITILFISLFFYKFAIGYKLNQNIIGYVGAMLAFIIVLFVLYKEKIDNEAISKKYDDLLTMMKQYEIDIEDQRTRIHETRNELMTIKSKITDKEKESEIVEYIDSVLGDKVSSDMSRFSKFAYLPSNGLKGFFYYKFLEAERNSLKASINVSKKIENCFLKDLDTKDFKSLVRIIGVYLDNAIEASTNSKDKKLGIEFYYINNKVKLIISNTFESNINLDKVGKEVYSTKGKNRGHGLLLVKRILRDNNIFETSTNIENRLYIQELIITNPNK